MNRYDKMLRKLRATSTPRRTAKRPPARGQNSSASSASNTFARERTRRSRSTRIAIAILEGWRDEQAANAVEQLTYSNKAKELRHDMRYIASHADAVEFMRIAFYLPRVRLAAKNFNAIADGMEGEVNRA